MRVLVDTPIWSSALRRKTRSEDDSIKTFVSLIEDARVVMIGAVRQELLSGIKEPSHFERLREHLRPFADFAVTTDDYEEAASFYNRCRSKGVQGSNTDFLICAIAVHNDFEIFTTDHDFVHFGRILPIKLHRDAQ